MSRRPASKAGSWYSADPTSLAHELDQYLSAVQATHASPAVAAIVPHAGLAYSGVVAARAYASLQTSMPDIETCIVFGAVHTCHLAHPAIWATGAWETPLGDIAIDEELAARLIDAGVGEENEVPHQGDNAIELQTPFLKHCFPNAKIVPIATPPIPEAPEAGRTAWDVIARRNRRVVAIGSSDLTHYGHAFGFAPAGEGEEAVAWSKANDRKFLDRILAVEPDELIAIAKNDRSACGAGAVAATVAWARAAGCTAGTLLEHTTSYDIMPDGQAAHFVGYGAVLFPAPA